MNKIKENYEYDDNLRDEILKCDDLYKLASRRVYEKIPFEWAPDFSIWLGDFFNGKAGCLKLDDAINNEIQFIKNIRDKIHTEGHQTSNNKFSGV